MTRQRHIRPHIVILTHENDLTADRVITVLRERDCEIIRWDFAEFPRAGSLTAEIDDADWRGGISTEYDRSISFEQLTSVWVRRPGRFVFQADMAPSDLRLARSETAAVVAGLFHATDCLWVNHPQVQTVAGLKPLQLRVARQCGFEIPRSMITVDAERARDFCARANGGVVLKSLTGSPIFHEDGRSAMRFTTIMTDEDLAELERIRLAPSLLQEYIPKQFELRLTVVGDEVFTVRINSQDCEPAKVDFRRGLMDPTLTYEEYRLPEDIEARVLDFARRFDLRFTAIDMIVTPDERYVFLESNPGAQWVWLEGQVDLPITEAVVGLLLRGSRFQRRPTARMTVPSE